MNRTLADLDWPRRTERLSLRPPTVDDLPAIYDYRRRRFIGAGDGAPCD